MQNKILATAGSQNFFVSLVSIILLALELNGLNTGADPEEIVNAISSGEVGRIVSIFFLNFLNPIMKLINNAASWTWNFLKSPNFLTQVVTAAMVGLAGLGIIFPDGAASQLVDAIFTGEFEAIAVAAVINVLNPLYHFFFDRPKEEDTERAQVEPERPSR